MIIVNLEGRLGNQLFQYAFAFNEARKKKTRFFFYPREKNVITKYFRLDTVTHFLFKKGMYTIYKRLLKYITKQFKHTEKITHTVWMHDIEIKTMFIILDIINQNSIFWIPKKRYCLNLK